MIQLQQPATAGDIRVAVIDADHAFRDNMVDFLNRQGYRASGYGSAGDFYRQMLSNRCDLVVIDFALEDHGGLNLSEYVRKNSDAGIVMLCPSSDIESRLAGYASGADACLVKPVDGRELASLIANMVDRRERSRPGIAAPRSAVEARTAEAASIWRLFRSDWSLHSPKGDAAPLTAKEYEFMLSLAMQSSAIVTRQYILKILGYQSDDKGNRALESLIYRLRKKIEEMGCGFPVKTYRGIGYSLSAAVVLS